VRAALGGRLATGEFLADSPSLDEAEPREDDDEAGHPREVDEFAQDEKADKGRDRGNDVGDEIDATYNVS
jgi:hypothetical protein